MKRVKVEERKHFNTDTKIAILEKSNYKCCHCGKPIGIFGMTVEHVIPISKGGTNDMSNLVALCPDCNASKDDMIVSPDTYYKYLSERDKDILTDNQLNYYQSVNWFDLHTLFPADVFTVNSPYVTLKSMKYKSKRGNSILVPYVARKVRYCDLDMLYRYKVAEEHRLAEKVTKRKPLSNEAVKEFLNLYFQHGVIYNLYKPNGDFVAAIPLKLCMYDDGDFKDLCMVQFGLPLSRVSNVMHILAQFALMTHIWDELRALIGCWMPFSFVFPRGAGMESVDSYKELTGQDYFAVYTTADYIHIIITRYVNSVDDKCLKEARQASEKILSLVGENAVTRESLLSII